MANLFFEYDHQAGIDKAKEVIDTIISEKSQKFSDSIQNLEKRWQGNSLIYSGQAQGISIRGKIEIEEQKIRVKAEIPFILIPFKSRIKETILNELKQYL